MGNIQIDMIESALFHFKVYGTGDHVTRGQFSPFVMGGHKARPGGGTGLGR